MVLPRRLRRDYTLGQRWQRQKYLLTFHPCKCRKYKEVLHVSAYCAFPRLYFVIQTSINYRPPIWLAYNIRLFQSWLDYRDFRMLRDYRMGRGRTTSHKRLGFCVYLVLFLVRTLQVCRTRYGWYGLHRTWFFVPKDKEELCLLQIFKDVS